jgi:myosin-5
VLQAIKLRYMQNEIYTYSGIVLIAANPFARVDSLYVPGMVQVYAGKQRSYGAPHLFAIAEEAFAYVFLCTRARGTRCRVFWCPAAMARS